MSLSKRLLSTGLSLSLMLSGATCSCAEPKKNEYGDVAFSNKVGVVFTEFILGSITIFCRCMRYELLDAVREDFEPQNHANVQQVPQNQIPSDLNMYVLQLRLTNAMLKKVKEKRPENEEAIRVLNACRNYLMLKLKEYGTEDSDTATKLENIEKKILNKFRDRYYGKDEEGNVVDGVDFEVDPPEGMNVEVKRDYLVKCDITQSYYLPVDIQCCAFINTDGDYITVHGISNFAVSGVPRAVGGIRHCPLCQRVANYFVPDAH